MTPAEAGALAILQQTVGDLDLLVCHYDNEDTTEIALSDQ
jgi:hypothetical protein